MLAGRADKAKRRNKESSDRRTLTQNKWGVIRRSWKVSITWKARFAHHAYQPKQRSCKIRELMSSVYSMAVAKTSDISLETASLWNATTVT